LLDGIVVAVAVAVVVAGERIAISSRSVRMGGAKGLELKAALADLTIPRSRNIAFA
jgi:hypothetical protein